MDGAGDDGNAVEQAETARQVQDFLDALPHAKALGMKVAEIGEAEASLSMEWAPYLVGDPDTGVIHGGAVSALLDTCSGTAVMLHPSRPLMTATIDLRVDYLRSAHPHERITAKAVCYHVTRSVAFVRVTANDETGGVPVATGAGTFTLEHRQ